MKPRMDRFDVNRDVPLPVRDESKAEPEPVMDDEAPLNEKEALANGLALLDAKWTGKSDFDKGMRLLQKHLGIKR